MMLYRYELYAGGEYQGVGIFQELAHTFGDERAKELAQPFDKILKIPPYQSFGKQCTLSFFTEKGDREFENAIKTIIKAYKGTCFEVKLLIIDEKDIHSDIIWSDEYQAIVREEAIICARYSK